VYINNIDTRKLLNMEATYQCHNKEQEPKALIREDIHVPKQSIAKFQSRKHSTVNTKIVFKIT
jgi:hypothetical protein